jgi:hypothetical protein
MSPATYGPRAGGPGYLVAPIKGLNADIFTHIILQTEIHKVPQHEAQAMIWGVALEEYDYILKNPYSLKLLKPEHLAMMRARQEARKTSQSIFNFALDQIPSELRQLYELQKKFADTFQAFSRGDMSYADLVRVAVLDGDPPPTKNERAIPSGRWQLVPGGYFVRCGTSDYTTGVVEIYVPHNFEAEYDQLQRPKWVLNVDTGYRVDLTYFDDKSFVPHPSNQNIKAYPFKKVVVTVPAQLTPDNKEGKVEINNRGYILTGPLASLAGRYEPKEALSKSKTVDIACNQSDEEIDKALEYVKKQLKDAGDQSLREYSQKYDAAMGMAERYEKVRGIWDLKKKLTDENVSRLDKVRALQDAIDLIPGTEHLGIPKELFKKTIGRQIDMAEKVISELGGEDDSDDGRDKKKKRPRIKKGGLAISGNPGRQRIGSFPH